MNINNFKDELQNLKSDNKDLALKSIKSLSSQKEDALPILKEVISSGRDEELITMATIVLGEMGNKAYNASFEVQKNLGHENIQLRMASALFFVRLGRSSIDYLKESIQKPTNQAELFWSSWALSMIDGKLLEQKSVSILMHYEATALDLVEKAAAQEGLAKIIGQQLND